MPKTATREFMPAELITSREPPMPPLRVLFALAIISPAFAGCVANGVEPAAISSERTRPTVVAVLDSGINPYHVAFQSGTGTVRVEDYMDIVEGGSPTVPSLVFLASDGPYEDRRRADDHFWAGTASKVLYAFGGTRLLGTSFVDHVPPYVIEDASAGHGTGTASMVARADPNAIIVMIENDAGLCWGDHSCAVNRSVSRSLAWAADQPWIDIISVSLNFPANLPDEAMLHPEAEEFLEASRRAVAAGKVVVASAGNSVAPPALDYVAGPPWVIAAGGWEPGPRGESLIAGKAPDVVANFTEWVASAGSLDREMWGAGTSYAAPIVAGTLARALHEVRAELGHAGGITPDGALAVGRAADGREVRVTAADLRAAMNASAEQFGPADWDPTRPTAHNDTLYSVIGQSLPVVAPFAQMGWGYVHGGLADEIARRAVAGDLEPPPGKAATKAWRDTVMAARESYWAARSR